MKFIIIFILEVLIILSCFSIETISIVTEPWEDATNEDGSGLYFDIIREVFDKSSYELDIKFTSYNRARHLVKHKGADMTIGVYKNEISGVIYPTQPLALDLIDAVTLKVNSIPIKNESDLTDRKIAWVLGYDFEKYIDQDFCYETYSQREDGVRLLMENKIEIILDTEIDFKADLIKMQIDNQNFKFTPIKTLELFVIFSDTEKGRSLAEMWDKRIDLLKSSGKYINLFKKWDFEKEYPF